jgi:leucyl/phenylalanyl-tRNA--protein transferase
MDIQSPPASRPVGSLVMLWHYANGCMPAFMGPAGGRVTWSRGTHRGVQMLDAIHIPKKQRPYVFKRGFEIRYNTAFEQVVRHCADPTRDPEGVTWMSTGLVEGYLALHELGFAQSFEAWEDGRLVGGGFGALIGGYVSVDSMFHLADDASKAAYVQMLLGLRDRGFTFVDINDPSPFMARWGAKWVPDWEFELMRREQMARRPTFLDGRASRDLPWTFRAALGVRGVASKVARRVRQVAAAVPTPFATGKLAAESPTVEEPVPPALDVDLPVPGVTGAPGAERSRGPALPHSFGGIPGDPSSSA